MIHYNISWLGLLQLNTSMLILGNWSIRLSLRRKIIFHLLLFNLEVKLHVNTNVVWFKTFILQTTINIEKVVHNTIDVLKYRFSQNSVRMRILLIFLISSLLNCGTSIKSFHSKLNRTYDQDQKISSAKLVNYPEEFLPKQFVICSSTLQGRIGENTKTLYILYRDEDNLVPWFSIGFWENAMLWANVDDSEWVLLGQVLFWDLFRWVHICFELDLENSVIKTSINGQNTTVVEDIKKMSLTPEAHLVVGVVDHSWDEEKFQFDGIITNIHILQVSST